MDEVWRTFLAVFVRYINNILCCIIWGIEKGTLFKLQMKLCYDARRGDKRDRIIAHETLADVENIVWCFLRPRRNGHDACTSVYDYVSKGWEWFSQVGWRMENFDSIDSAILLWQQQDFKESRKNRNLEIVFGSKCGFAGYADQQSLYKPENRKGGIAEIGNQFKGVSPSTFRMFPIAERKRGDLPRMCIWCPLHKHFRAKILHLSVDNYPGEEEEEEETISIWIYTVSVDICAVYLLYFYRWPRYFETR